MQLNTSIKNQHKQVLLMNNHTSNTSLIKNYQNGDIKALDLIIKNTEKYIYKLISKYPIKYQDKEDMYQSGIIGLMTALQKFDLSKKVEFLTFATPFIRHELSLQAKQINTKLSISEKIYFRELKKYREEQKDNEMLDIISNSQDINAIEIADNGEQEEKICTKVYVESLLNELSEFRKNVLIKNFFLDIPQTEIAKKLNLTASQVRTQKAVALTQIRKNMAISF